MSLTIETLSMYLGKPASFLLDDPPFRNWTFEKSIETDLEKPLIDYVFAQHGVDFVCGGDNCVETIFLYADKSRFFKEGIQDLPFTLSHQEVIARLGFPSKSGGGRWHQILGDRGSWDRFDLPDYSIHVEYRLDDDRIQKVTFMRADVVP